MAGILVTRPAILAEPLIASLDRRGHTVFFEPMASLRPVAAPLPDLSDAGLLMITSQAALLMLAQRPFPEELRNLPCYCVGPASAARAKALGLNVVHVGSGGGEQLAQEMVASTRPSGSILHLCATEPHAAGEAVLRQAGCSVKRWAVYEAVPAQALSSGLVAALEGKALDLALFYSPKAARTFEALTRKAGKPGLCASLSAIALSQQVADVLQSVSWREVMTAGTPREESILAAIDQWNEKKGTGHE